MKVNKLFFILIFLSAVFLTFLLNCQKEVPENKSSAPTASVSGTPYATSPDIDIEKYSLKITGAVENQLNLTFEEVKKLPAVREDIVLWCPGYFKVEGYWTGTKISGFLDMAGLKKEAKKIKFIGLDGYYQTLTLEEIKPDGFLVAWQYNDLELSKDNGFPLRIVAKDKAGSIWVRWLGEIEIES
jgi:DMSO/TMAO reductase YedYZ molybdopterin-dependent catalytic subunit